MKKRMVLGVCLILCLLAAGCSKDSGSDGDQGAQATAQATGVPASVGGDVPTMPPEEQLAQVIDPSFYEYQTLDYSNGTVVLEYPAHWNRVPGTNTICYIEPVADDDEPARFALTKKSFSNTPTSETKSNQLQSFITKVVADYDSYEVSPQSTGASFIGDTDAYYATYTAVKGDITVKGYVLMARLDQALYAFHFRAPEDDYDAFTQVMEHIRGTITIK